MSKENTVWMKNIITKLCNKNRILVSADNEFCLKELDKILPLKIHKYPTGGDYSTWIIPKQWDVKEACLSDGDKVIASYQEHPMFLAAYSIDFEGWVSKDELLAHTLTNENRPDDFVYQHRLALNCQKRLKDWGITLPFNRIKTLDKDKYFLKIKTKVSNGNLLVGEHFLRGRSNKVFSFLSHLCHCGQANDGLAGIVAAMEVMKRLGKRKSRKFSYQFLVMPETYGSAVYLSANQKTFDKYLGVLFLEMAGAGEYLTFNHSRKSALYFDKLLEHLVKRSGQKHRSYEFHRGIGNDELNFDWPAIGIPGLALYWDGFPQYHTSADSPELIDQEKLNVIVDAAMAMVDIIEEDFIPAYMQKIPIYQSRYDLYVDFFNQKELYHNLTDLLFSIDGKMTLFELVFKLGISFKEAKEYIEKYVELGFIKKEPLPMSKYEENLS